MTVQLDFEDLNTAVHAALNAWNKLDGTPQDRLEHLLIVQSRRTATPEALPVTQRLATNDLLHKCIEELGLYEKTSANILTWRYLDGETVQASANRIHLGRDQFLRRQRKAIKALTQIILAKELAAQEAHIQKIESSLMPPSYNRLFGADEALPKLMELLLLPDAPWIITLTGIGGIGKTSLADATVRQIIQRLYYDRVLWIPLSPQSLENQSISTSLLTYDELMMQLAPTVAPFISSQIPSPERNLTIQQLLKASPHLIIIDNLEADVAPDLMTRLHNLANPTKFLLTSRLRMSSPIGIFDFPIQELQAVDAIALMRNQAHSVGAIGLAAAADELLYPIYERVGGNPLALKLMVGLNHDLSLSQILEALIQVNVPAIENLYRHIYEKIWQILSDGAKALLEVMPLASDVGIVQAQLQAISQLDNKQLVKAIQELSLRSLLEIRGTPSERRYTIHSLTRTFLRSEIIQWPNDSI